MEDSLKRLQQYKRQANRSQANTANQAMSDDDKIRLQLSLDVAEFGRLLAEKFDGYRGESNYDSLRKMVDDACSKETPANTTAAVAEISGQTETNGVATGANQAGVQVYEESETTEQII
jgi:hypothetical protein